MRALTAFAALFISATAFADESKLSSSYPPVVGAYKKLTVANSASFARDSGSVGVGSAPVAGTLLTVSALRPSLLLEDPAVGRYQLAGGQFIDGLAIEDLNAGVRRAKLDMNGNMQIGPVDFGTPVSVGGPRPLLLQGGLRTEMMFMLNPPLANTIEWAMGLHGADFVIHEDGPGSLRPGMRITEGGNLYIGTGITEAGPQPADKFVLGATPQLTLAGTWIGASSRELKDDIRPLEVQAARNALKDLDPVRYRYKQTGERHVGFIAEDVPDLVATNERKSIIPIDVIAVLTQVVKDQETQIQELERLLAEEESR